MKVLVYIRDAEAVVLKGLDEEAIEDIQAAELAAFPSLDDLLGGGSNSNSMLTNLDGFAKIEYEAYNIATEVSGRIMNVIPLNIDIIL